MIFADLERIVFAGDSVTDAGSTQPVGEAMFEGLGNGYVRVIDNMLAAYYPKIRIRVTNAGISGNKSRDLLQRFEKDVIDLNPDWVSICIGVNDVWRQFDLPAIPESWVLPDEYEKNVERMILSIKDKVKGIFILTPFYIEPNKEDMMRARIDEYVEICKNLAKKHNCKLINFQKMFDEYCSIRHSSYIAWDRVHPNKVGATLMAREFLKECEFDYTY